MPKVVSWNIRHGGGSRLPLLLDVLRRHGSDLVVLTEFRNNENGRVLRSFLAEQGLVHQVAGDAAPRVNTLLVASRDPIEILDTIDLAEPDQARCILLRVGDFHLGAFYFPQLKAKVSLFEFILRKTPGLIGEPTLLVGDFNTGKHFLDEDKTTFTVPFYLDRMEAAGWTDAWRHFHPGGREYTWYSTHGNGFRIDHAFASPSLLPRLSRVEYSHEERLSRASDHSVLMVDLV
jgi:exodeoxyribonuclease III